LSVALSSGQQVNPILLLEPTTTVWMYQNDKRIDQIGSQFQSLLMSLERAQVEYDLGSEDIIARNGSADGPWLVVGRRRYRTIVLPPRTENLNAKTVDLLESCLKAGATVLCCSQPPERVDGRASSRGMDVSKLAGWKQVDAAALSSKLLKRSDDGFAIERDANDHGLLFHHRRQLADGQLLFLVNTSMDSPSRGTIRSPARGIEQWCPTTGRVLPYHFTTTERGAKARFELSPCGSLLLLLSNEPKPSAPNGPARIVRFKAVSPPRIRRLDDNVLVLDYLDLTTGGQTTKSAHCRQATRQLFIRNGFSGNPWFESVQFADEHIRRKFPPESGFEATYRFVIATQVPERLQFVLERPDLYKDITCNGVPVAAIPGAWWLDRSFGRIDIHTAAQVGENTVTIKASPFTVFHELEPAYVLGNFSLQPAENGFVIAPETPMRLETSTTQRTAQPKGSDLQPQGWNAQGHPFYSTGVAYVEEFDVSQPTGRYFVELSDWLGSVAKVSVNGKSAGYIAWRPWEYEVSELIRPGHNQVEIIVIGTLRNTLGPFHAGPPRGVVMPNYFNQAPASGPPPGRQYNTIAYGLFRPFVLKNVTLSR
jgi:hypothetical protein